MINQQRQIKSIAWAWAAGWMLASMGQVISDVFSSPNRGLTAFYVLGFAGWAIGAAGTIRYVRNRFGADVKVTALSAAGWGFGALAAVVLGLFWMETWNVGFLGSIAGPALGGAIGGALTLPIRSLSSPATILRASVRGALCWGAAFLVFQFLALYTGYFLMQMTIVPLLPILGPVWATFPGWAFPAGAGGFLSAQYASRSLNFTEGTAV